MKVLSQALEGGTVKHPGSIQGAYQDNFSAITGPGRPFLLFTLVKYPSQLFAL